MCLGLKAALNSVTSESAKIQLLESSIFFFN